MEKTLIILKPDAVQRGLVGQILSRFEQKGFKIIGLKMIKMDEEKAKLLYEPHEGKEFFYPLVSFITSSPVVLIVLEGRDVVSIARNMIGSLVPTQSQPGTIRGDFVLSSRINVIHGSDSLENARREINIFFSNEELLSYEKTMEKWIYE